jgi:hypothetical protein
MVLGNRVGERRFKANGAELDQGRRLCRVCFTVVTLKPDYIELTPTYAGVRCPHCGHPFPIRRSDVAGVMGADGQYR